MGCNPNISHYPSFPNHWSYQTLLPGHPGTFPLQTSHGAGCTWSSVHVWYVATSGHLGSCKCHDVSGSGSLRFLAGGPGPRAWENIHPIQDISNGRTHERTDPDKLPGPYPTSSSNAATYLVGSIGIRSHLNFWWIQTRRQGVIIYMTPTLTNFQFYQFFLVGSIYNSRKSFPVNFSGFLLIGYTKGVLPKHWFTVDLAGLANRLPFLKMYRLFTNCYTPWN